VTTEYFGTVYDSVCINYHSSTHTQSYERRSLGGAGGRSPVRSRGPWVHGPTTTTHQMPQPTCARKLPRLFPTSDCLREIKFSVREIKFKIPAVHPAPARRSLQTRPPAPRTKIHKC